MRRTCAIAALALALALPAGTDARSATVTNRSADLTQQINLKMRPGSKPDLKISGILCDAGAERPPTQRDWRGSLSECNALRAKAWSPQWTGPAGRCQWHDLAPVRRHLRNSGICYRWVGEVIASHWGEPSNGRTRVR